MRISLASREYEKMDFFCPQLPSDPSNSGNFQFRLDGSIYDVTEATIAEIEKQLANWLPHISRAIRLTKYTDDAVVDAPVVEVPAEVVAEVIPPAAPVETLSDGEYDEIAKAVELLDDKTIAEAQPILEAQAADESKSLLWRRTYLEEVSTDSDLQKTLNQVAANLLEALVD